MKGNQPNLLADVIDEQWSDCDSDPDLVEEDRGHGRIERRSTWILPVPEDKPLPGFPSARQKLMTLRERRNLQGEYLSEPETSFFITSLAPEDAGVREIAPMIRGHWSIEALHHVRDVTYHEDRSRIRTGNGPRMMASLRNLAIGIFRMSGESNTQAAMEMCCQNYRRCFSMLCGRKKRAPKAA